MIINLHFKTPDAVYEALKDIPAKQQAECERVLAKWIWYGEMVNLTVDTENETIVVKRRYET